MNELALFAGIGGGILGGKLLGWRTVCAVERDAYAASILAQRQNDKILEPFPIWSDVQTFDGRPWKGIVDVVSGGFPCQDISIAGKGAGIYGERSGMWKHMARIIGEVRPKFAFMENSPMLLSRGLFRVLGDLSEMGYDAKWGIVSARDAGAPHLRKRIWIVATNTRREHGEPRNTRELDTKEKERTRCAVHSESSCPGHGNVSDTEMFGQSRSIDGQRKNEPSRRNPWVGTDPSQQVDAVKSDLGRVANGNAFTVDRLKAIGNAQIPRVAKLAWELLT